MCELHDAQQMYESHTTCAWKTCATRYSVIRQLTRAVHAQVVLAKLCAIHALVVHHFVHTLVYYCKTLSSLT